jgi:hypothetical protein
MVMPIKHRTMNGGGFRLYVIAMAVSLISGAAVYGRS